MSDQQDNSLDGAFFVQSFKVSSVRARSVEGDVKVEGGLDEHHILFSFYLSPENARALIQQINGAAADAAAYRLGEREAPAGGESE